MKKATEETVKTSIKLPRVLWQAAHVRAMEERTDLAGIVRKALEQYLKRGGAR